MPITSNVPTTVSAASGGAPSKLIKVPSSRSLCKALEAYNTKQRTLDEARKNQRTMDEWRKCPERRVPRRQIELFGETRVMHLAGNEVTGAELGRTVRRGLLDALAYAPSGEYPCAVARDLIDTVAPTLDEATRQEAQIAADCVQP